MVYFELNNWACGKDYPNEEPFLEWMANDLGIKFLDEEWVKENYLIVVASNVDMSVNLCITASEAWVEINCPSLLTNPENHKFLRESPWGEDDVPEGRFGCPFYSLDEILPGLYWASEKEDDCGYLYYSLDKWVPFLENS